jgi:hypothetical protein
MSDIFFNVYLFIVILSFYFWLFTPVKAEETEDNVQFESLEVVEVQQETRISGLDKVINNQDSLEEKVLELKVNALRRLAQKLRIKRNSGRRTLNKEELKERIIEFLKMEPERVNIALVELEIEKVHC